MLKKLLRNKNIISMVLLLFMVASIVVVPILVSGNEPQDSYYIGINDDDDDDEDDDGISDEYENDNSRTVEIDIDNSDAQITSELDSDDDENSFQINIDTEENELSLEFEFDSEINSTEIEIEFEILFTQLIGYNDTDADNIYNPSIDDTIVTHDLGEFNPIVYNFENNTDGELHKLSVMSTDGKFGIIVYVSNEFVLVDGNLLAPTEIKFDILINDFVGNFSRVALKTELAFEGETEYEDDTYNEQQDFADDEASLEFNINEYIGYFSWSQIASTDGETYTVYNSEFDPQDSEQVLYLNYKAGNAIIHDPKIGIANVLIGFPFGFSPGMFFPELSRNGFLIVSAAVTFLAIGGTLLSMRKKRK